MSIPKDTFGRFMQHKAIAQEAQAGVLYHPKTPPGFLSVKVGFRSYRFMTGCGCKHLHLVADGGAILEACGGDCEAHEYERAIHVSENAVKAGEEAFGRPGDLRDRTQATFRDERPGLADSLRFYLDKDTGAIPASVIARAANEIERLTKLAAKGDTSMNHYDADVAEQFATQIPDESTPAWTATTDEF